MRVRRQQIDLRLQGRIFVGVDFAVIDKMLAIRISAGLLAVTALGACAQDVVYQVELTQKRRFVGSSVRRVATA